MMEYGGNFVKHEDLRNVGCVIVAFSHNEFEELSLRN